MTAMAGIGFILLTFSPAFAIFRRFIMTDPLRIILFAFGAFFWLLSLLFSSVFWFALVPLRNFLLCSVIFSIILQELSRLALFILIKKAQKGLSFIAASDHHKAGVHTLYNARHMLAIVCGLGMGVMSAYFLVINVVADFWGEGTVGFPATVSELKDRFPVKLLAKDQLLPVTYSISGCFLTLSHVFWTILFWDACHKKEQYSNWWRNIVFVVISHMLFSGMSFFNQDGKPVVILCLQFCVLLINAFYAVHVIAPKATTREVIGRLLHASAALICCRTVEPKAVNQAEVSGTFNIATAEPRVADT